ncbi:MAG: hypothetical protein WC749_01210 [Dehalococcoidia bacterium]
MNRWCGPANRADVLLEQFALTISIRTPAGEALIPTPVLDIVDEAFLASCPHKLGNHVFRITHFKAGIKLPLTQPFVTTIPKLEIGDFAYHTVFKRQNNKLNAGLENVELGGQLVQGFVNSAWGSK